MDWSKGVSLQVLSVTGNEDFQYANLGQVMAGGDFFDGIGQFPAKTKSH
jgi:hypothetical protein